MKYMPTLPLQTTPCGRHVEYGIHVHTFNTCMELSGIHFVEVLFVI